MLYLAEHLIDGHADSAFQPQEVGHKTAGTLSWRALQHKGLVNNRRISSGERNSGSSEAARPAELLARVRPLAWAPELLAVLLTLV